MTKVALITGAARRVGAQLAKGLHASGCNVIVHYRSSKSAAEQLVAELNQLRANSAICLAADFNRLQSLEDLISQATKQWQRLDVLINNASDYFPTHFKEATQTQWDELFNSNVRAAYFLTQAAKSYLTKQQGCVVNISDVNANRARKNFSIYCMAKSALNCMTKCLANELAPHIRVNAVAPGTTIWPEHVEYNEQQRAAIMKQIPLKKLIDVNDIVSAVLMLALNNNSITGEIITIDAGQSL